MANIMNPKVEASGFADVAFLGIAKSTTERLLTPVIGNATAKSGIIKLATGGLISGKGGKVGKALSGGLIVDGIEDMVSAVLGNNINSVSNQNEAW